MLYYLGRLEDNLDNLGVTNVLGKEEDLGYLERRATRKQGTFLSLFAWLNNIYLTLKTVVFLGTRVGKKRVRLFSPELITKAEGAKGKQSFLFSLTQFVSSKTSGLSEMPLERACVQKGKANTVLPWTKILLRPWITTTAGEK